MGHARIAPMAAQTLPKDGSRPNETEEAIKTHRIEIAEAGVNAGGLMYRVWHDSAVLLNRAREPMFEACRALAAKGLRGRLEMVSRGGSAVRTACDIDRGATLSISERDRAPPTVTLWRGDEES